MRKEYKVKFEHLYDFVELYEKYTHRKLYQSTEVVDGMGNTFHNEQKCCLVVDTDEKKPKGKWGKWKEISWEDLMMVVGQIHPRYMHVGHKWYIFVGD